ncbi:sugar transferase [Tropicimonas sp. IMCC34011]|uniref:sugar transferase n=1 Tax=Tropicimonas sp. IMCC34011 TaxID=2248759 RepID=UPI000E27518E|nr:sugar transferase [Tropicimonas sp. IMCC34011]
MHDAALDVFAAPALGGGQGLSRGRALPSACPRPDGIPAAGLYSALGKRALDLSLALLMLPIVAPLIVLLWALVRADGGAGFFGQTRIGRGGRTFRCWKLRTMVPDAEAALARMLAADPDRAAEWARFQKLARDPRITPVGRILRATSLDELPQIWNVIRGDMSLVGPRPFLPAQAPLYRAAGGRGYFDLRPGITGPWQVEGRGKTAFADRAAFDNAYAAGPTLRLDLLYLARTAKVLARRTGQ